MVFVTIHAGAGSGILLETMRKFRRPFRSIVNRPKPGETYLRVVPSLEPESRPAGYRVKSATIITSPLPAQGTRSQLLNRSRLVNALTVDVEDYYQVSAFESFIRRQQWPDFESRVEPNTHKILEALNRAEVRGTFFVLGYVAQRHPELIRTIHEAGHEIGCHSYWHRLVYHQTPAEFREDLQHARDLLQD
ncbi:MAG TPA: polysaccharide deacetylase family protein, partial [Gemmataceae bacterium]|nr:polysaccharide deacetylase family protein [Gemmataceae bacterium]